MQRCEERREPSDAECVPWQRSARPGRLRRSAIGSRAAKVPAGEAAPAPRAAEAPEGWINPGARRRVRARGEGWACAGARCAAVSAARAGKARAAEASRSSARPPRRRTWCAERWSRLRASGEHGARGCPPACPPRGGHGAGRRRARGSQGWRRIPGRCACAVLARGLCRCGGVRPRRGGGHPAGRAGAAHPGVKGLAKGSWCKGKRGKEQARCAGPPVCGACASAVAARRRVRARVGPRARSRRGDRKTSQCFWRWLRARALRGARARAAVLVAAARVRAVRGAARIRRETWLILPVLYAHLKD